MKKRIFCMFLCVCMLVTSMLPVMAQAEENEPTPALTYIAAALTSIDNVNGRAVCTAWFDAYPSVTKFNIKLYFEKKGLFGLYWTELVGISHTFYVTSDVCERTYDFDGNGTYRVRAVYTAYCGDQSESVTGYSGEYKYKK